MDFGFLKKIFSFGKKSEDISSEISSIEKSLSLQPSNFSQPTESRSLGASPSQSENIATDNIKAKLDLMAMQMDGMKIQYESINQRLMQIENMVRSIYESTRPPSAASRY